MTTFDEMLEEVGTFGPCQKRIFAMLCLVSLPFAGALINVVFQGFTPEHWCRNPAVTEMRQRCGWSLADTRRHTVPLINTSGELLHSTCKQYDLDWNATGLTCDTQKVNLSRAGLMACKLPLVLMAATTCTALGRPPSLAEIYTFLVMH